MSGRNDAAAESEELAVMPPALVQSFTELFAKIPQADSSEAMENIVLQILSAETPEELDSAWDSNSIKNMTGRVLVVTGMKLLPSDYANGPQWYLGLDVVLEATGETGFVSCSSVSCMAQLAHAYNKGWLPLKVVPRQAERQSRNGYYPIHLEIMR